MVATKKPTIVVSQTPQAIVDNRSDYYVIFTIPGDTQLLISVPQWTKITLRLETSGPVAVGTRASLTPVGSGKGRTLPTDQDIIVTLAPNTRFYYAATGINRVAIHVETIPWLQSLFEGLKTINVNVGGVIKALLGK